MFIQGENYSNLPLKFMFIQGENYSNLSLKFMFILGENYSNLPLKAALFSPKAFQRSVGRHT
jgi:hypothetical protein